MILTKCNLGFQSSLYTVILDIHQVVQNIDDLFDREELSASPDAGWPDCFNSGVYVFVPSDQTYRNLLTMALSVGSFDGKLCVLGVV